MGYRDDQGNWIEEFRSREYSNEEDAIKKIQAVIDFHVSEGGWQLNGTPHVEKNENGYVAVIPLMKPAELEQSRSR